MPRFLILAVALALVPPPQAAPQSPAAAPGGLLMSTEELAAAAKDPSLVILHVADRPSAFEEAHIPGARFIRYGDFAIDGDQSVGSELPPVAEAKRVFEAVGVSNHSRVVVYAASPVTAARAFFTLDAMGHDMTLDAGWEGVADRVDAWVRRGGSI